MNYVLMVPRALGSTLMIPVTIITHPPHTLHVQVLFRDGRRAVVHRDGIVQVGGR